MKRNFYFLVIILCIYSLPALSISVVKDSKKLKVSTEKIKEIENVIDRVYENDQVSGTILVAVDGKIIFKKAYGYANLEWKIPNTLDTKFRIASVSKPFTAILILQLVEEGKLKLDGRLTDYLPDFPKEKGENITIHQLLTHTSGIISESKIDNLGDIERLYHSKERLLKFIAAQDIAFNPGERRGYSNFGYALLAMIAEEVSGKDYAVLLKEVICDPAGMKNTLVDSYTPLIKERASGYQFDYFTGYENSSIIDMSFVKGYGHLLSTAEDLHLFDQALYGDKILSEESKKLLFDRKGQFGWEYVQFKYGKSNKEIECNQYNGSINGFGSHIQRIAKDKVFICILRNLKEIGNQIVIKWPNFMASRIVSILYDEEYEQPKKSAAYEVFKALIDSGTKKAGEKFEELKSKQSDYFYFDENEFNILRKKLLAKGMSSEAKAYFKPYEKRYLNLSVGKLQKFVGKYHNVNNNIYIEITIEDDTLLIKKMWDNSKYKIFPITEFEFYEKEDIIKFEFSPNEDGLIESIKINNRLTFKKD
jgi:CubicO group peptidase (beta-lactamase class C family)